MSWNIKSRLRDLTSAEKGLQVKDPGGRLSVALIWPGTYRTGMSALGFMSIYGLLNSRSDVLAERFFWPAGDLLKEYDRGGSPLLSLESARPLGEFDLVAASLSLENDYWFLPKILARGGLAPKRADRDDHDPPVLAGGVAVWANPHPILPFVDLVLTGEAEAQWSELISAWNTVRFAPLPRTAKLCFLGRKTPGTLHPGAVTELIAPPSEEFRDHNFCLSPSSELLENLPADIDFPANDARIPVKPAALAWPPPEGLLPPVSPILTPNTEFANIKLVEISRGCPYGCRFCLAGFIFRPHRPWPLKSILEALGPPEVSGEKVGLVSPAAADHPDLEELMAVLFDQGRTVTLSSLRLTALTAELAEKLARGRLQGVAVAPEGGGQRLRDVINKALTEIQILHGVKLLTEAGLQKIKLYFMVGLPGETDEDLTALVDLCRLIREAARRGAARPELMVSLANFTPKAHTPFEEAPMNTEAEFKRKGRLVSQGLKGVPRLSVHLDPPLWSIAQGLLARGGSESVRLVEAMVRHEGRLKPSLVEFGYSPDHPIHQPWPQGQPKPWRVVEPAVGFDCLSVEMERAEQALVTAPCPPAGGCDRCLACGHPD